MKVLRSHGSSVKNLNCELVVDLAGSSGRHTAPVEAEMAGERIPHCPSTRNSEDIPLTACVWLSSRLTRVQIIA